MFGVWATQFVELCLVPQPTNMSRFTTCSEALEHLVLVVCHRQDTKKGPCLPDLPDDSLASHRLSFRSSGTLVVPMETADPANIAGYMGDPEGGQSCRIKRKKQRLPAKLAFDNSLS